MNTLLVTIGPALVGTLMLTPLVRYWALRWGVVDRPDGHRKTHGRSIPLGGGVAVFLSTLVTFTGLWILHPFWGRVLREEWPFFLALGAASLVLLVVGLLDDRFNLRGRQKLLGQILAAGILAATTLTIHEVTLLDWKIELGLLAIPCTILWLVAAINALNLIDGLDGLASSVGIVLSLALAGMAWLTGHSGDAILALILVGSLLGFLFYNAPPASIFLGDAGSMLIGLALGALAVRASLKGPATIALAAPTAIWAIPIFDVVMAILRRKLTGRSIYSTDQGHLHHCLTRRGFENRKVVVWIGGLCFLTGLAAFISELWQNELLALGGVAAVLGTLVATRLFGAPECMLLCRRIKGLMRSFIPRRSKGPSEHRQQQNHLRGNRNWKAVWGTLVEFAERFDLCRIQLNVNLPALHEEYHATLDRRTPPHGDEAWVTTFPLWVNDRLVGRLEITGDSARQSMLHRMAVLITSLEPFEDELEALVQQEPVEANGFKDVPLRTPSVFAEGALSRIRIG